MAIHMGCGYGSEFHLMRVLGRYRNAFTAHVQDVLQGTNLTWLDMLPAENGEIGYDLSKPNKIVLPDRESVGIKFLGAGQDTLVGDGWRKFWPQSGTPQNWDAVGRITLKDANTWLLVEAKAHTAEIESDCKATSETSKQTIHQALKRTAKGLGIEPEKAEDWLKMHYQAANRLAMLHFLNNVCGIPTVMLNVYFCGDKNPRANCPSGRTGWSEAVRQQDEHLGLDRIDKESKGWHSCYWDVVRSCPAN